MKPLVIYHGGGCTDGFGAAFAAWLKLGDEAEYLPMEYMRATDGVTEFHERVKIDCSIGERDVYILDFSLPKVVMISSVSSDLSICRRSRTICCCARSYAPTESATSSVGAATDGFVAGAVA